MKLWLLTLLAGTAIAQMPILHDPSTILRDGDQYYVFSTGKGIPIFSSPDLKTWHRRGSVFPKLPPDVVQFAPGNDGLDAWAPDILRLGDTFYLYYAVSKWDSHASAIGLATNTTLDPASPAYHWVDRGTVVHSNGTQRLNAIDPGVILTSDGTLWLAYGSYFGPIDLVQLDPKTGLQLNPDAAPIPIATNSEAADIIQHNGWFYLFLNHGTCCQSSRSTYHVNVGRSRKITGPYLDRNGNSLETQPGEPFLATEGDNIGPGHFGLVHDSQQPERFSIHYEAGAGTAGKPTLAIRTLTWSADGWPIAGPLN